jgi:hypothetical protein
VGHDNTPRWLNSEELQCVNLRKLVPPHGIELLPITVRL